MSSRNNLLRRLAGSSWGANTSTLRTGALALVYSAAEYAAPAWCRSAHTRKLDTTLNDTMRLITGCLRSTPSELLPVLAGIAPAALRREHLTHSLVNKASLEPRHPLHNLVQTSNSVRQRLPSRRPFSRHATTLSSSNFNMLEAWRTRWQEIHPPAQFTVHPNTSMPPGAELACRE